MLFAGALHFIQQMLQLLLVEILADGEAADCEIGRVGQGGSTKEAESDRGDDPNPTEISRQRERRNDGFHALPLLLSLHPIATSGQSGLKNIHQGCAFTEVKYLWDRDWGAGVCEC